MLIPNPTLTRPGLSFQLSNNLSMRSVSWCILSQFYLTITAVWKKGEEREKKKGKKKTKRWRKRVGQMEGRKWGREGGREEAEQAERFCSWSVLFITPPFFQLTATFLTLHLIPVQWPCYRPLSILLYPGFFTGQIKWLKRTLTSP